MWISVTIVLEHMPALRLMDFIEYAKNGCGKDAQDSGLFVYVEDRRIHSVFIIDRSKKMTAKPVNCRKWKLFVQAYVELRWTDPGAFVDKVFSRHKDHMNRGASRHEMYNLAETVLGSRIGSERTAKADLMRELQRLSALLPTPTPKATPPSPPKSPPPASSSSAPTRRSSGAANLFSGFQDVDRDHHPTREATAMIALANGIMELSDAGDVMSLIVEEFLLVHALKSPQLNEAFDAKAAQSFEKDIMDSLRAHLKSKNLGNSFPCLLLADSRASPSSSRPLPVPAPRQLFRQTQLRAYFARFRAICSGRAASTHAALRHGKLSLLIESFYATQLFRPPSGKPIIDFFSDRHAYASGSKALVGHSSVLFRSCDGQVRNSLPETNEPPDREAKKRKSLDAAKEAMQQRNRHNQLLLSDESIIVLTIMKHVAEVSDEKFLLLQHLMHLLYVGAPLTKQEAAQLTIGGDSLVNRARQLKWALNQQAVQKINNAPGVKSLAGDDTEIDSANCGSRCIGYFDEDSNAPASHPLSGAPTGRKTSDAGASALISACQEDAISTDAVSAGSSDNAPNAKNSIFEAVDKADDLANGRDGNGEIIRTVTNGVLREAVWTGSQVHIHHLGMGHFRKKSFGAKTGGVDDASAGQLCYKWGAILSSDQKASVRGVSSIYLCFLVQFFGGKGFWCKLLTEENEGRWGQSLQSRKEIIRFIDEPIPPGRESLGDNCLAAASMFIRKKLKPSSWQIYGCYLVAVWSMNKKIVFMIRLEVELGVYYERELNWLRRMGSSRKYLEKYPPDFKLRELPGHLHSSQARFLKALKSDPFGQLPTCRIALADLSDEETRDDMVARVQAGADAYWDNFKKHNAWIYSGHGIALQINSPGLSGPVARGLVRELGEEIFVGSGSVALKERALRAVDQFINSEEDRFWHPLIVADKEKVRQFVFQFHLVCGEEAELPQLMKEWVLLCENPSMDPENDGLIHDRFAEVFPVLHARQQHFVDPCMSDTLMREAEFSVRRRLRVKQLTSASFELRLWWHNYPLKRLRETGREFGKKERAASTSARDAKVFGPANKPAEVAASAWCRTHGQCAAITEFIATKFFPMVAPEIMVNAPRVRKDLKIGDGLVAKDEALAATWAEALVKDSEGYRREVTLEELRKQAGEVVLTFNLPAEIVEQIPLRSRLDHDFKHVRQDRLHAELQCYLPLALLCMRAVSDKGTLPTCSFMKVLTACLLPPRLPLSALSSLEMKTVAEASTVELRKKAIEKATKVEWCFNARGGLMKGKALKALGHFSWSAVRILEFLGNYRSDVQEELHPEDAGSSAAMFILGPFMFGPENRKRIGCEVTQGSRVAFLPKHGVGGFESALATVHEENTAVQQALA